MRSLRSGVAMTAIALLWSSAAFGFNLFGSSDDSDKKPKPAPQAQTQAQPQEAAAEDTDTPSLAKTLAANLDSEIERAKAQRVAGDLGGAAHSFAQMVLVAPDDARVCGEYGKTLALLGRSDDAIAFLKRAIELKPNDWTLYSAIGVAFDQKSQFADAKAAYQRGLQLNPMSAALLNNYAMSRMLAGDLPAAQALIAQAQATGDDPKIASNAALMATLRGQQASVAPVHPVTASVAPAALPKTVLPKPVATATLPAPIAAKPIQTAVATPAPVKTTAAPVVPAPQPLKTAIATPVPTANAPAKPVQAAIIAPVAVKTATAIPAPVKTTAAPLVPAPQPVKTAIATPAPMANAAAKPSQTVVTTPAVVKTAIATPAPVKTTAAPVVAAPQPIKTAIAAPVPTAPTQKPTIVKTETGRVMMQAVPKDPEAGPVKTADTTEPEKPQATSVVEAKTEATSAPRALASAAPSAPVASSTPDLRAASD